MEEINEDDKNDKDCVDEDDAAFDNEQQLDMDEADCTTLFRWSNRTALISTAVNDVKARFSSFCGGDDGDTPHDLKVIVDKCFTTTTSLDGCDVCTARMSFWNAVDLRQQQVQSSIERFSMEDEDEFKVVDVQSNENERFSMEDEDDELKLDDLAEDQVEVDDLWDIDESQMSPMALRFYHIAKKAKKETEKAKKELEKVKEGRLKEKEGRIMEKEGRIMEKEKRIKEKEGRIKEKEGRIKEKERRIVETNNHAVIDEANKVSSCCNSVLLTFMNVDRLATDFGRFGDETSLYRKSTPKGGESALAGRIDVSEQKPSVGASARWLFEDPETIPVQDLLSSLRRKDSISPLPSTGSEAAQHVSFMTQLETFQNRLQVLFQSAAPAVATADQALKTEMETTFHMILNLNRPTTHESETVTDGNLPAQAKLPPPKGKEWIGPHTLLYGIMFEIGGILKEDIHITKEQATLAVDEMSGRNIDIIVSRVSEHMREVLAFMCHVPIEIKPLRRFKQSLGQMLKEGSKQVTGHLGKAVIHALNYGGIGIDTLSRGAVVTLISVEVLEMELKNAGTAQMELHYRRSGAFPLFDEATTTKLIGLNKKRELQLTG